jgi:hypothetical protein
MIFAYYFVKVHVHQSLKINSQKKSQNSRNHGFSSFFDRLWKDPDPDPDLDLDPDPDLYPCK